MKILALVLIAAASMGCTGESMDLLPRSSPLVGTWNGYVEGFTFESGSDRIEFAITEHDEATGAVRGTVTLGEGPPPPPAPTNPDVGWLVDSMDPAHAAFRPIQEGVPHPLTGDLEALRFRARYSPYEIYDAWCRLQTPITPGGDGGEEYGCLPEAGIRCDCEVTGQCMLEVFGTPMPPPLMVDCGRYVLCNGEGVCDCTAEGCTAGALGGGRRETTFDVALDGEIADGTVDGELGMHNIRLERLP